jgi:hypothetical protein
VNCGFNIHANQLTSQGPPCAVRTSITSIQSFKKVKVVTEQMVHIATTNTNLKTYSKIQSLLLVSTIMFSVCVGPQSVIFQKAFIIVTAVKTSQKTILWPYIMSLYEEANQDTVDEAAPHQQ